MKIQDLSFGTQKPHHLHLKNAGEGGMFPIRDVKLTIFIIVRLKILFERAFFLQGPSLIHSKGGSMNEILAISYIEPKSVFKIYSIMYVVLHPSFILR